MRPTVGLDEADDDVGAAGTPPVTFVEHGVGLADAGRGAEIDPQLPALAHPIIPSVAQASDPPRARPSLYPA